MIPDKKEHSLNFFAPRGTTMRREVRVISLILAGWLLAIIGFQMVVIVLEQRFESMLNDLTFFNLPIHFWLTGQLLPLWFILLCAAFNLWMDRHTPQQREGSLRFHIPAADSPKKGE
jgi:putative solute:sodium symporter small subunit